MLCFRGFLTALSVPEYAVLIPLTKYHHFLSLLLWDVGFIINIIYYICKILRYHGTVFVSDINCIIHDTPDFRVTISFYAYFYIFIITDSENGVKLTHLDLSISPIMHVKKPRRSPLRLRFLTKPY